MERLLQTLSGFRDIGKYYVSTIFDCKRRSFHKYVVCSKMHIMHFFSDIPDYWPELGDDLTDVKWSHATNTINKLDEALNGRVNKRIYYKSF